MAVIKVSRVNNTNMGYFSEGFRDTFRQHLPVFLDKGFFSSLYVTPYEAKVYKYNLTGYLLYKKITDVQFHWMIALMSGIKDEAGFNENIQTVLVPDATRIKKLYDRWNSRMQAVI